MRENASGGVPIERFADDFPRMNARAVNGAREQLIGGDHSMSIVQPDDVELLMKQVAHTHPEEVFAVTRVTNFAQALDLAAQDFLGCCEHVLFGRFARQSVMALRVSRDTHVRSPRRRIAPWAPGREAGKGLQHLEASAVPTMKGGNEVDEGETLARADREATIAHISA